MSDLNESGFKPYWWDAETLFTEEQLQRILGPLKSVNAQITQLKARLFLEPIARRHGELRSEPSFNRSNMRKKLERIRKLSAQLRREIFDPLDQWLDLELASAQFHGKTDWGGSEFAPYSELLELLERKANELAEFLKGRSKKPPNVDEVRNATFASLARTYETLTHKRATVRVGTDSFKDGRFAGKAIGPFVEFVQAFMSAIPDEPIPTGDQIKWFVACRNGMVSERSKNRDAHHYGSKKF